MSPPSSGIEVILISFQVRESRSDSKSIGGDGQGLRFNRLPTNSTRFLGYEDILAEENGRCEALRESYEMDYG